MKSLKRIKISLLTLLIMIGAVLTLFTTFQSKKGNELSTYSSSLNDNRLSPVTNFLGEQLGQLGDEKIKVSWTPVAGELVDHYILTWKIKEHVNNEDDYNGEAKVEGSKTSFIIDTIIANYYYDLSIVAHGTNNTTPSEAVTTTIKAQTTYLEPINPVEELNAEQDDIKSSIKVTWAYRNGHDDEHFTLSIIGENDDSKDQKDIEIKSEETGNYKTFEYIANDLLFSETYEITMTATAPLFPTSHPETTTVVMKNAPLQPVKDFQAKQIENSSSVNISWTYIDTKKNLDHYILKYKKKTDSEWQQREIDKDETSTIKENLLFGNSYDLSIVAHSDDDENTSPSSAVTTTVSLSNEKLEPVSILEGKQSTKNVAWMDVEWWPKVSDNLSYYILTYEDRTGKEINEKIKAKTDAGDYVTKFTIKPGTTSEGDVTGGLTFGQVSPLSMVSYSEDSKTPKSEKATGVGKMDNRQLSSVTNLKGTQIGISDKMKVTWEHPNPSTVDHLILEWESESDNSNNGSMQIGPGICEITIDDIPYGDSYKLTMTAHADEKNGQKTPPSCPTTATGIMNNAQLLPVTNLKGTQSSETSNSMTVTWKAIDKQNVDHYKLTWNSKGNNHTKDGSVENIPGSKTSFVINELEYSQTYDLSLISYSGNDKKTPPSNSAKGMGIMNNEKLKPVTSLAGKQDGKQTTMTVSWIPVNDQIVDHYVLTWKTRNTNKTIYGSENNIAGDKTSFQITGLSNSETYDLTLVSHGTDDEKTPPSNPAKGMGIMNNKQLLPVTDLKGVQNKPNNSMTVTWTPVAGQEVDHYELSWMIIGDNSSTGQWAKINGAETSSHQITDLSYGVTYEISIISKTKDDIKTPPSPKVTTTRTLDNKQLSPVSNLRGVQNSSNSTSMDVSWTKNAGEVVEYYSIEWAIRGTNVNRTTDGSRSLISGDETTLEIENLLYGQAYDLTMIAHGDEKTPSSIETTVIANMDKAPNLGNLVVTNKNENEIEFSWTLTKATLKENPNITSKVMEGDVELADSPTITGNTAKIGGLKKNTEYKIIVIISETNSLEKNVRTLDSTPTNARDIVSVINKSNLKLVKGDTWIEITWDYTQIGVRYEAELIEKGVNEVQNNLSNPKISANQSTVTLRIDNLSKDKDYRVDIVSRVDNAKDIFFLENATFRIENNVKKNKLIILVFGIVAFIIFAITLLLLLIIVIK